MVMIMDLPQRKINRLKEYDYNQTGAYFITICTQNREKVFWSNCRGELCSPANIPLSNLGITVENEIKKLDIIYDAICVDKYVIMPDHIHFLITINSTADGRTQFAPTIARMVKQFKGSITKQIGRPIWQKSYYDHIIRNQHDYNEVWQYIENNPLKWILKKQGVE